MSVPGPFDNLRPQPKTRITTAWGHGIVDALNLLYGSVGQAIKYYDLGQLGYDIVPDADALRSLGSSGRAWLSVYSHYGFFSDALLVQGKPVIKDGDPISLYDILDAAYGKLHALEERLRQAVADVYNGDVGIRDAAQSIDKRLASMYIDSQGRVGVTILSPLDPYGNVQAAISYDWVGIASRLDEVGKLVPLDSTTSPLAANASWTSAVDDSPYTRFVCGYAYSDQAGTLYVEQSPDGVNWDLADSYSVSGGAAVRFSVEKLLPYARVRYVNGAAAQTVFRLYVYRRLRL